MTTSIARSDCIYCGTEDSKPDELQGLTSPRIPPYDAGTCASHRNSSARCPDRSPAAGSLGNENGRSTTRSSWSRPRSRCIRSLQRPGSAGPSPASTLRTGPVCVSGAGRDPALSPRPRFDQFWLFPPSEYSPSLTLVFVSTEISRVSGSARDAARTAFTLSKIASVCSVFFRGLPF